MRPVYRLARRTTRDYIQKERLCSAQREAAGRRPRSAPSPRRRPLRLWRLRKRRGGDACLGGVRLRESRNASVAECNNIQNGTDS
jgi:hypothetical protein